MSAQATLRSQMPSSPVGQRIAGVLMAFALLLQAMFATPLALRMASDEMRSLQFGVSICTATADAGGASHHSPPQQQLPVHSHGQCLICHGHALPFGLLAVVLCVLVGLVGRSSMGRLALSERICCRRLFHSYPSRAPPVTA